MDNKRVKIIFKATVMNIMVAFIYFCFLFGFVYIVFFDDFKLFFSVIDTISVNSTNNGLKDIKINADTKMLSSYPEYGSSYATLKIDSIKLNKKIYYGDDTSTLSLGIGHSPSSYFPGEGGSVLYMGHNTFDMLRRLPDVRNGDIIKVDTSYGSFSYEVFNSKIILETDLDEVSISDNDEILMIYTCYPVETIFHTDKRYVVYAKRV